MSAGLRTVKKWQDSNFDQCQSAENHQRHAQVIVGEAVHAGEDAVEITHMEKNRADRKLEERVHDLQFHQNELQIQKDISVKELDILLVYKKRVESALEACTEPLAITRKCLQQRQGRIGIELVHDSVVKCLRKEEQMIVETQKQLRQTVSQAEEQARLLRATQYTLDKDLSGKESAIGIDKQCTYLTPSSASTVNIHLNSTHKSRTIKEWEFHTKQNISASNHQVKQSRTLRSKINMQLQRAHEDIISHYECTNRAFRQRIEQTKDIKNKLENELAQTTCQANIVRETLTKLEEPMSVANQHITLVFARLSKRAQRSGIEQCRDAAELQLEEELRQLYMNIENLKRQQEQAEASLRCLRRTVEEITEDLNKKINTLLIDEVHCMTQRLSMNFHQY